MNETDRTDTTGARREAPVRVAVIGGGCAAMTTAFELSRPELRGRYAVTVYQQGWRLGGKGASGRGRAGRIEEHGLHLWMGWYENAFRLMRETYDELDRDASACPITTWREAFHPADHLGVMERGSGGDWTRWTAHFPASDDSLPGDPYPEGHRFTLSHYMVRGAALIRSLLQSMESARGGEAASAPPDDAGATPLGTLGEWMERLGPLGEAISLTLLSQAAGVLEGAVRRITRSDQDRIGALLGSIERNARRELEALTQDDSEMRRLWIVLDLTLATMRGVLSSGLLFDQDGFDKIDHWECRDWLMHNGAARTSVESGYLRGLYDLGFSYEDADPNRPSISAGQAMRSMVRAFFTYRGAFFWTMQGGMGDIVFAPLYELLRRRGVKFEFFHRLENVEIAKDPAARGETPHVTALQFDVQARVAGGRAYEPLVDFGGLPCWLNQPDWEQLEGGARMRDESWKFESFWDTRRVGQLQLEVGRDFDLVVLGASIGAIPHVCSEIVASDPRWRTMVEHVRSVATQAFQVWMKPDMEALGWKDPATAISGFVEPFDTWADMAHLIPREAWPNPPRALAYFCNVLPDVEDAMSRQRPDVPVLQREIVRRNAVRFLDNDVEALWPGAIDEAGAFRWDILVDSDEATQAPLHTGEKRFDSQFWTANVSPTDRYCLSLPGSAAKRISPLDTGYDNLTIAGDWTSCGFNAGCVEAAVISGLLAAHAIAGHPRLEDIIGYDHP